MPSLAIGPLFSRSTPSAKKPPEKQVVQPLAPPPKIAPLTRLYQEHKSQSGWDLAEKQYDKASQASSAALMAGGAVAAGGFVAAGGIAGAAVLGAGAVVVGTTAAGIMTAGGMLAGAAMATKLTVWDGFYINTVQRVFQKQKQKDYIKHSLGLGGIHLLEGVIHTPAMLKKAAVSTIAGVSTAATWTGQKSWQYMIKPLMNASVEVYKFLDHLQIQSEKFFTSRWGQGKKNKNRESNVILHYGYMCIGGVLASLTASILGIPKYGTKGGIALGKMIGQAGASAISKLQQKTSAALIKLGITPTFEKMCKNEKMQAIQKSLLGFCRGIASVSSSGAQKTSQAFTQYIRTPLKQWRENKKTLYRETRTNAAPHFATYLKNHDDGLGLTKYVRNKIGIQTLKEEFEAFKERRAEKRKEKSSKSFKTLTHPQLQNAILKEGLDLNHLEVNLQQEFKTILGLNEETPLNIKQLTDILKNTATDNLELTQQREKLALAMISHAGQKILKAEAPLESTEIRLLLASKMLLAKNFNLTAPEKSLIYQEITKNSAMIQNPESTPADINNAQTEIISWVEILQNTTSRFEFNEMVRDQKRIISWANDTHQLLKKTDYFDHRQIMHEISILKEKMKDPAINQTTRKKHQQKLDSILNQYRLNAQDLRIDLEKSSVRSIAKKLAKFDTIPRSSSLEKKIAKRRGVKNWHQQKSMRIADAYIQQLQALTDPAVQQKLKETPVVAQKINSNHTANDYVVHMGRKFLGSVLGERVRSKRSDTTPSPVLELYLKNRAGHGSSSSQNTDHQKTAQQIEYISMRRMNLPMHSAGATAVGAIILQHAAGGYAFAAGLAASGFPGVAAFSIVPVLGDTMNNAVFGSIGFLVGTFLGVNRHRVTKLPYLENMRQEYAQTALTPTPADAAAPSTSAASNEIREDDVKINPPQARRVTLLDDIPKQATSKNKHSVIYGGVKQPREGGYSQVGLQMRKIGGMIGEDLAELRYQFPIGWAKLSKNMQKKGAAHWRGQVLTSLAQRIKSNPDYKKSALKRLLVEFSEEFTSTADREIDLLVLQAARSKKSLDKLKKAIIFTERYFYEDNMAQKKLHSTYQKQLVQSFEEYIQSFQHNQSANADVEKQLFLQSISLTSLEKLRDIVNLNPSNLDAEKIDAYKTLLDNAIAVKKNTDKTGFIQIFETPTSEVKLETGAEAAEAEAAETKTKTEAEAEASQIEEAPTPNASNAKLALEMPAKFLEQLIIPRYQRPWQINFSDRIIGTHATSGIENAKEFIMNMSANEGEVNDYNTQLNQALDDLQHHESLQIKSLSSDPAKAKSITITKYDFSKDEQGNSIGGQVRYLVLHAASDEDPAKSNIKAIYAKNINLSANGQIIKYQLADELATGGYIKKAGDQVGFEI